MNRPAPAGRGRGLSPAPGPMALSVLDAMEHSACLVDRAGTIIAVNRSWQAFAADNGGDASRTAVGRSYFDVCADAEGPDRAAAGQAAAGLRALLAGDIDRFELDYPCHSPTVERWLSLRIHRSAGAGAVVAHVDLSPVRQAQDALVHHTLHDELTGLPNRALLADRLSQALAWAGRQSRVVAVAHLGLDHFRRVNDSLGHQAGDALLRAVVARLSGLLRVGDTLARFVGDELVVVWPALASHEQAQVLAAGLVDAFAAPFDVDGASVALTASVGVAVGAAPRTPQDLLLAADAALQDAKQNDRGAVRFFTEDLRTGVEARVRLEADLRAGLTRGELVLHYQPVIDLRTDVVTGVEALVRWAHPDGLRMPDAFIPVAEASGLIVQLGEAVLEEACRQGAAWAAAGLDLQIAVNFSARQVSHQRVITSVDGALRRSGLLPHRLLVEVTESTMLEDAELAEVVLSELAALGPEIAIDDFGTGYSSLLYLKRYPVRALKVDRSFVAGMGVNVNDDAIVASVISLAHAVGAVCIAEGVETQEQAVALRALGCDFAQGYLFGRPMPAKQIPSALAACAALLPAPRPGLLPTSPPPCGPQVAEVTTLRRVRQLHAGGASLQTISAVLNREGHLTAMGARWSSSAVAAAVASVVGVLLG